MFEEPAIVKPVSLQNIILPGSMIFEEITEVVVRGRRSGEVSARETLDIHRKCLRLHWERGSCWNLP